MRRNALSPFSLSSFVSNMISLLKSEVPAYLKKGEFFRALGDDED
jgi:hypothetical protein